MHDMFAVMYCDVYMVYLTECCSRMEVSIQVLADAWRLTVLEFVVVVTTHPHRWVLVLVVVLVSIGLQYLNIFQHNILLTITI